MPPIHGLAPRGYAECRPLRGLWRVLTAPLPPALFPARGLL